MSCTVTRSHRVNCDRCKHLLKEKSGCNGVRYLISATKMRKRPVKALTRGVYNEKEKVLGSKKGFCREVDKQMVQKGRYSETFGSVEKDDLGERPAVSVYNRITRAKSKYISGTEMACNSIRVDDTCNDIKNTMVGEKSNRRAKGPKVHKVESISQADAESIQKSQDGIIKADVEFDLQKQDRMIEVRLTRSKKNLLLQMEANKDNAGGGDLHACKNEESCFVDSDKNPILTYNHTLQRKRKRMSAMMYDEGLEDSYYIPEKGLGSEPSTKKEFPFGAVTRNSMHKQNAVAVINAQTIKKCRQSNGDLQSQSKEDIEENVSCSGLLTKPAESRMQNDEILLGSKDSQYHNRKLRNKKHVDKEKVNPVQVSDSSPKTKLREKIVECTLAGPRRAKVISTGSIPKRVTRSMLKASLEVEEVHINEEPAINHKRKHKGEYSVAATKSLRTNSQPSSPTVVCTEEIQQRGELCLEDNISLKIGVDKPDLDSTGKLKDSDQHKSGSNNVSGKLNLSESIKGIEDFEGKGHLCKIPKRKEKQRNDMRRKEYLTRSKNDKRHIQEEKEKHSSLKAEGSTTPCYKIELNLSTKEAGDSGVPPIDDPNFLPSIELAKVDNSVGQSSKDIDSADYLSHKREGDKKSSLQGTSDFEQTENVSVETQSLFPCYEQICKDTIPKTTGRSNAVREIHLENPIVFSNVDQLDAKSGDLSGSNRGHSEKSTRLVETSRVFAGYSCPESNRKICDTTFISSRSSDPVKKCHVSGLDEHDCVQHGDFMGDDKNKCLGIMTNPNDLGGRQIRPRPLDPLQPLPIFIEGRDQEFHGIESVSYLWHPRQHEEDKFSSEATSMSEHKSLSLKANKQEIKIPSYRTVSDYDEVRRLIGGNTVYTIPGSYVRHIQMSARNQKNGSEYDIEDDDQEWLRNFNKGIAERKSSLHLTEDKFEELIEYFEKKSAKVSAHQGIKVPVKNSIRDYKDKRNPTLNMKIDKAPVSDTGNQELVIPWGKASSMLTSVPQTSDCCICNGGENSVSNPVYQCKSCAIYVHGSCYGVHDQKNAGQADRLQISDWLCRKCEVFDCANIYICCAICCKSGGALKPTTIPAKWAHVVCALYTNETFFLDTDSMEPIDGISAVEVRSRKQKRLCCFCGARVGACECCSVYGCGVVFHISCGVNRGAYFEMQHNNQEVVNVRSFCPRHANMALLPTVVEEESIMKDKDQKNEKGKAEKTRNTVNLQSHSISLATDETNISHVSHHNEGQLQYSLMHNDTDHGFVEEGSNGKDACQIPFKDDASVLKRQRRRKRRHRFKSAVRLNRCKTVSRNKMLFVDDCLPSQRSANNLLYLTSTSQRQQGTPLADDKGANLGHTEANAKGKSISNVSDKNQFIRLKEVLKANIGPPFVVREVYSYWLSKRAKKKGPLLQRLQQEETVKIHGIFNQDSVGIRAYFGLKEDSTVDYEMALQKLRGLQRDLKSVRSIAKLVVDREKIKTQFVSEFQKLAETKLFALQKELGLMSCFICTSCENLLLCSQCKRIFCFQCYKRWTVNGMKSYRFLSCRKFFCKDCEGVFKTDSINSTLENISRKSQTEDRAKIFQVPNNLWQSSETTVKLPSESRSKVLEVKNAPFSRSITNGVYSPVKHEVAESIDSKDDASINPNTHETNDPFSLEVMDGHPLDSKGKQQSPCKIALLSKLADVVSLNTGSLVKGPTDSYNNVRKTRYKRRKLDP